VTTHSNKSWRASGKGIVLLKGIDRVEHEMCYYLERKRNLDPPELTQFEYEARRDFAAQRVAQIFQIVTSVPRIDISAPATGAGTVAYPSPPDSPASLSSAHPLRYQHAAHQQMTLPSDATANATSSHAPSVFCCRHWLQLHRPPPPMPKMEPGYAHVSRTVW
jgi:hypothetical protein